MLLGGKLDDNIYRHTHANVVDVKNSQIGSFATCEHFPRPKMFVFCVNLLSLPQTQKNMGPLGLNWFCDLHTHPTHSYAINRSQVITSYESGMFLLLVCPMIHITKVYVTKTGFPSQQRSTDDVCQTSRFRGFYLASDRAGQGL